MRTNPAAGMTATLLLVLATPGQTQVPFRDGVELEAVVRTALAISPDVERARLAVEAEAGARLLAASPFDPTLRTALLRSSESLPVAGGPNGLLVTESIAARASMMKSFRSGVVVSSDLSLDRVRGSTVGLSADQARSSVSVLVPLAGGRGGGAAAGAERAAAESHAASRWERDHIVARSVRDASQAYWLYLAAHEQLRTHIESADRARRLVEETEILIRADERPLSDLDLMASNLAQKQTAVTAARQTLLDARYALGVAMGLGADAVATLGPPVTKFPEVSVHPGMAATPPTRAEMVGRALSMRRDLAALQARRTGARLAWEGALRDARPRWDVLARIGYTGVSQRSGFGTAYSFPQGLGGLSSFVQIQYEPVVLNQAVQGRARRTAALQQSATVAAKDLIRRIEASVHAAIEGFANSVQQALAAREAVRLAERSVATEQEKFRLGLAALFDAILAEDSLTNARLQQTNARFRFAMALLRLRFETATLLETTAGGIVPAGPDRMTSPFFEERKP